MYRACERFNIRPPRVQESWEDCDVWTQAMILAYDQLRGYEENQEQITLYKCLGAKIH